MNIIKTLILVVGILVFIGCDKSDDTCLDKEIYGNATINGYNHIEAASAQFVRTMKQSLSLNEFNENCQQKSAFHFSNIDLLRTDTSYLSFSPYIGISDFASLKFRVYDGDATPVETYLLDSCGYYCNWVVVESINSDSTKVDGSFSVKLITSDDLILSGERDRWDDPSRPDTLLFTGHFSAVRND